MSFEAKSVPGVSAGVEHLHLSAQPPAAALASPVGYSSTDTLAPAAATVSAPQSVARLAKLDATIPVVDMQDLYCGDPLRRARFVKGLGDAFRTVGFVAVTKPGVDVKTLDAAYDNAKAFFSLPQEVKMRYFNPDVDGQRGYVPSEKPKANGEVKKDVKEFYHIGRELPKEERDRQELLENIWPESVDFKRSLVALYNALEQYIIPLQEAMAEAIGQPRDLFTKMTKEGESLLRALHYLPNPPVGAVWAGEHTDTDLFAILPRATEGGLEVKNQAGEWISVQVPDDAFIINCGDYLENMTNGEFKSAWHRVQAPKERKDIDRYSMVLFIHPRKGDKMDPLPESIARTGGKALYPTATRQELLSERLTELGLAKRSLIEFYAESGLMERAIEKGRGSIPAMKILRDMNLASETALQTLAAFEAAKKAAEATHAVM